LWLRVRVEPGCGHEGRVGVSFTLSHLKVTTRNCLLVGFVLVRGQFKSISEIQRSLSLPFSPLSQVTGRLPAETNPLDPYKSVKHREKG
jgi:hypothetical protein